MENQSKITWAMDTEKFDEIVSSLFNIEKRPQHIGFTWVLEPETYDPYTDCFFEGGWTLVPNDKLNETIDKEDKSVAVKLNEEIVCFSVAQLPKKCEWGCPDGHLSAHSCYKTDKGYEGGYYEYKEKHDKELIEKQREIIRRNYNPNYYTCKHDSHFMCTNSICCDTFWHEGECHFISEEDGEEGGMAWRYGDQ